MGEQLFIMYFIFQTVSIVDILYIIWSMPVLLSKALVISIMSFLYLLAKNQLYPLSWLEFNIASVTHIFARAPVVHIHIIYWLQNVGMRRRQVLGLGELVVASFASGCGALTGDSDTSASGSNRDCDASPPMPAPTDHSAASEYPDPPESVSPNTLGTFAEASEQAYQRNDHVGQYPRLFGWMNNDLRVLVDDVTTSRSLSGPSATVSGEVVYQPDEPQTVDGEQVPPLPTRHSPFEATFEVADRVVTQDGDSVACIE